MPPLNLSKNTTSNRLQTSQLNQFSLFFADDNIRLRAQQFIQKQGATLVQKIETATFVFIDSLQSAGLYEEDEWRTTMRRVMREMKNHPDSPVYEEVRQAEDEISPPETGIAAIQQEVSHPRAAPSQQDISHPRAAPSQQGDPQLQTSSAPIPEDDFQSPDAGAGAKPKRRKNKALSSKRRRARALIAQSELPDIAEVLNKLDNFRKKKSLAEEFKNLFIKRSTQAKSMESWLTENEDLAAGTNPELQREIAAERTKVKVALADRISNIRAAYCMLDANPVLGVKILQAKEKFPKVVAPYSVQRLELLKLEDQAREEQKRKDAEQQAHEGWRKSRRSVEEWEETDWGEFSAIDPSLNQPQQYDNPEVHIPEAAVAADSWHRSREYQMERSYEASSYSWWKPTHEAIVFHEPKEPIMPAPVQPAHVPAQQPAPAPAQKAAAAPTQQAAPAPAQEAPKPENQIIRPHPDSYVARFELD